MTVWRLLDNFVSNLGTAQVMVLIRVDKKINGKLITISWKESSLYLGIEFQNWEKNNPVAHESQKDDFILQITLRSLPTYTKFELKLWFRSFRKNLCS